MTRIAITGAAGFLGQQVVALLRERGDQIRALVRERAPADWGPEIEVVRGDVRQVDAVRSLVEGTRVVIHLAASFDPADDTSGIIVEGTERVIEAAREAGVDRVIFLSCLGADAAAPSPFYRAKWRAERTVLASGLPYVILRPSLLVGRHDGVLRPLADLTASWPVVPVAGRGEERIQPIDVGDAARCVVDAMERPQVENQVIDLGGPAFLTFRQLIDLLGGVRQVAKPKLLLRPELLSLLQPLLPPASRILYRGPRLAQFRRGVVTSPGAVQHWFDFVPASILPNLRDYLS